MQNLFNQWKENATRFLDVRTNLVKLTFVERTSNVLSFLIYIFILLFLSVAVLIFLGIALQETFTTWFDGNRVAGAFATFGFYVLLAAVVVLMRKAILNGFAGIFVRILTSDDEDEMDHARKIQVKD